MIHIGDPYRTTESTCDIDRPSTENLDNSPHLGHLHFYARFSERIEYIIGRNRWDRILASLTDRSLYSVGGRTGKERACCRVKQQNTISSVYGQSSSRKHAAQDKTVISCEVRLQVKEQELGASRFYLLYIYRGDLLQRVPVFRAVNADAA
jgi:hypothetical protein